MKKEPTTFVGAWHEADKAFFRLFLEVLRELHLYNVFKRAWRKK